MTQISWASGFLPAEQIFPHGIWDFGIFKIVFFRSGEMDELCDPDYYMSFSNNNTDGRRSKSVIPYTSQQNQRYGTNDSRQPFRTVSQRY
jgi:hypothetical protein